MATFKERAANSVGHMFSLYFDFVILVIFGFGFKGGIWILIAPVPPGQFIPLVPLKTYISKTRRTYLNWSSQTTTWFVFNILYQGGGGGGGGGTTQPASSRNHAVHL